MHYENYIKFDIPSNETFEYEGLKLINESENSFHMFLKRVDFFDGEIIEMEEESVFEEILLNDEGPKPQPIEEFQQALELGHIPAVDVENITIVE